MNKRPLTWVVSQVCMKKKEVEKEKGKEVKKEEEPKGWKKFQKKFWKLVG